jgi:hypothetical protein
VIRSKINLDGMENCNFTGHIVQKPKRFFTENPPSTSTFCTPAALAKSSSVTSS